MKIKEVGEILGVSKSALRYYEQYGLLQVQRNHNNDRIYSDDNIDTLKIIIYMRNHGFKMKVINEFLLDQTELQNRRELLIREKKRILLSILQEENTLKLIDEELERIKGIYK